MEPPRRPKVSPLFAGPRPNPKPRNSEAASHARRIDHSRLKPAKPQPSNGSVRSPANAAVETLLPGDSLGLSAVLLRRRRSRPSTLDGPQLGDALWDSVGSPQGSGGGSGVLNWPSSSGAGSLSDGGSVGDGHWGSSRDPLWESLQEDGGLNYFPNTDNDNKAASFSSTLSYSAHRLDSRVPGAAPSQPLSKTSFRQREPAKYAERPSEVTAAAAAAELRFTSDATVRAQDRRLDFAIRRVNSMASSIRRGYHCDKSGALPLGSANGDGSGLSKSLPQSLRFTEDALNPNYNSLDIDPGAAYNIEAYNKEDDPRNSSAALDALCASVVQKAADALAQSVQQHASRKAEAAAAADPMAAQGRVRRAFKSSKVAAKAHAAAEQAEAAERAAKRAHALSLARAIGGSSSHAKRSDSSSARSSRGDSRSSSQAVSAAGSIASLRSGLGTPPALPSSLPPLEGGHRHSSLPSSNPNHSSSSSNALAINGNGNFQADGSNSRGNSRSGSRLGAQPEQATAAAQGTEIAPGPQMSPVGVSEEARVTPFPTEAWGDGGGGKDSAAAGEQPASRSPSQSPPLEDARVPLHETRGQPDRWADASTVPSDGGGSVHGESESVQRRRSPTSRSRSPPLPPGIESGIGGRGVRRLTSPSPASPIYPDSWPRGRPPGVDAGPSQLPSWQPPHFTPIDPLSPRDQAASAPLEVNRKRMREREKKVL